MSRHVADKRTPSSGARVRRFAEIERTQPEEGSHPSVKTLLARPSTRDDATKLVQYTRVERGWTA
jgi:hypothetical protein